MMQAKIEYENLRIEMARKNMTVQNIAQIIGRNRNTTGAKLSMKRELSLKEAFLISKGLGGLSLSYLFADESNQAS